MTKSKVDVNECDEGAKQAARVFYERYIANSDGLNFRGEPCPAWQDVGPQVQSHWCAVAMLASAAAMAVVKEFVWLRLSHMQSRPMMWATTKESLGVQLILLAEMVLRTTPEMTSGIAATSELSLRLYGPGSIVPAEPLDEAWAGKAVAIARDFLEEKCRT
jgi:hypothetical protein